jgi:transposase
MGTAAVRTAKTRPASWDAFADVDVFVDEALTELAAMEADGTKSTRSGPKPALTGAALHKAIMAIWCLCFCGMQWRAIGQLCDLPFSTLFTLFSRWARLGLWRRLLDRLRRTWRLACVDTPEPSAVVIDSPLSLSASGQLSGERSCRSAPSCFERGFDGGEKINGVKVHLGVDKYGICWVVERSFSWIANYRRLNTIFERTKEHLVAFIKIAFVSILSRRIKRLVIEEVNA